MRARILALKNIVVAMTPALTLRRSILSQSVVVFCIIFTLNTHISLNSTDRLVFTVDMDCIFCEVGTEFLHIIYIMAPQAVVPVPLLVRQPCLLVCGIKYT
jgi:hypothetical protein